MSEISKTAFIPLATKAKNNRFANLLNSTVIVGVALAPCIAVAKESETKTLPTVTVIDSRENESYNSTESSFYKLNGPLLDQPKTVSTVSRQLMDDQGLTKVSDALRNVPGVSLVAGEGGNQGDNLTIRGFSARNDFFIDGMRDFGSYFRDSFNLETIEVVQGPSSILFGRGTTGGAIQQNSKQAFLGTKKEGDFMLGTNETTRAAVDVNTKISDNSAFRLNAMGHRNKVAKRDETLYRRAGFAPSLAFGLGTDTRLNISHLYQAEDNIPDYGAPFFAGKPANANRNNFYGFKNSDHLKTDVNISTVKLEHDISKDSTFRNQTRYARYFRDGQVTEPQMKTSANSVDRIIRARTSVESYLGNQTDISNKFSTYGIEHAAIFGLALESETSTPTILTYSGVPSINLYNPDTSTEFSYSGVTPSYTKAKLDTIAVYATDNIKFNKSWELALGARFDNLKSNYHNIATGGVQTNLSRTDNLFSYSAGLVYKPTKNGSIYFNYGTSFNPSAETLSLSTGNANIEPEQNRIYEIGTKWDLLKKRLSTTLAIFRADKDNARETIDANGTNALSGSQRVYGLTTQITGNITEAWKISAGYSYLDGKVTSSIVNPAYVNRPLAYTPEHSFTLFTTYKVAPKLEVGGGANFVSERFVNPTYAGDEVSKNLRSAPSYLIYNVMAKYPLNKNIDLQLNVNNIFNTYYFDSIRGNNAALIGEGRAALLSTKVKF